MSISPAAIQRNILSSPGNSAWLALLETVAALSTAQCYVEWRVVEWRVGIAFCTSHGGNAGQLPGTVTKPRKGGCTSKHRVTYVFL